MRPNLAAAGPTDQDVVRFDGRTFAHDPGRWPERASAGDARPPKREGCLGWRGPTRSVREGDPTWVFDDNWSRHDKLKGLQNYRILLKERQLQGDPLLPGLTCGDGPGNATGYATLDATNHAWTTTAGDHRGWPR